MRTYAVTYTRDEGGWWIARVGGVKGVHSNGRTIAEARRRVREALALAIGEAPAEAARLVDDVRLPAPIRSRIEGYRKVQAAERKARDEAQAAARALAPTLVRRLGLSTRDVGEILGISHQRVHQLSRETP
ncbi:MAG TPA: type II toxin-antitoxin system HicB family antitoxin [Anaeromyxobacteraceae bacterium]|nr:type II toxin-antitoxin system HicB family antitoxin [Anaeromyxobacteraceae bacterium]